MKKKDLQDWLSYFETLHPVGIDMGLERVDKVWSNICSEHNINSIAKEKVITVAGTNGKGSACQMISMLLMGQGYTVGMYTSPHIHFFNERIKINEQMIDDELIVKAFEAIETARESVSLSYFEATTLVGLLVFAWGKIDYVVLEVGLGGRLDAINVINADASMITSIGKDHGVFLGNDLGAIAVEKAGVFRRGKPSLYAHKDIYPEVISYALEKGVSLYCRDKDYSVTNGVVNFNNRLYQLPKNLVCLGDHQINNAAGVIVLLFILDLLPENFNQILSDFSVDGRLQKINTHPDVIVDVAHNEDAAIALFDYLSTQKGNYGRIIAVVGMLIDKNHNEVLRVFDGAFDLLYCGSTLGERGFSGQALAECSKKALDVPVEAYDDIKKAFVAAKNEADNDDLIIAFGSFLVAKELI